MNTDVDEPIELVSYDPAWPKIFTDEAARLATGLSEKVTSIEHVGSTASAGYDWQTDSRSAGGGR